MNYLDSLRYAIADELYRAEGRYGTLEDDIRYLDDELGEDPRGWVTTLDRVRRDARKLAAVEHNEDRLAAFDRSVEMIDRLLSAIEAATSNRPTIPCPAPAEEAA